MEQLLTRDGSELRNVLHYVSSQGLQTVAHLMMSCRGWYLFILQDNACWRRVYCVTRLILEEELQSYEQSQVCDWRSLLHQHRLVEQSPEPPEQLKDELVSIFWRMNNALFHGQNTIFMRGQQEGEPDFVAEIDGDLCQEIVGIQEKTKMWLIFGSASLLLRMFNTSRPYRQLSFAMVEIMATSKDPESDHVIQALVDVGYVDKCLSLLSDGDEGVYQFLGNLSAERLAFAGRELIPKMGKYFAEVVARNPRTDEDQIQVRRWATYLSNCAHSEENRRVVVALGGIAIFTDLLFHSHISFRLVGLAGLANISLAPEVRYIPAFFNSLPSVIRYVKHYSVAAVEKCFAFGLLSSVAVIQPVSPEVQQLLGDFLKDVENSKRVRDQMEQASWIIHSDNLMWLHNQNLPDVMKAFGLFAFLSCPRKMTEDQEWHLMDPIIEQLRKYFQGHDNEVYQRLAAIGQEPIIEQ